jgi:hypothetical protein
MTLKIEKERKLLSFQEGDLSASITLCKVPSSKRYVIEHISWFNSESQSLSPFATLEEELEWQDKIRVLIKDYLETGLIPSVSSSVSSI